MEEMRGKVLDELEGFSTCPYNGKHNIQGQFPLMRLDDTIQAIYSCHNCTSSVTHYTNPNSK